MPQVLTIPTYEGSGQALHPDVIKVGSEYVMAMTPLPFDDDSKENPSVLISSDGIAWSVPPGVTNPVAPTPVGGHNADPDLTWDGSAYHLYYLERILSPLRVRIYHKTATTLAGLGAAPPTVVIEDSAISMLSPAVLEGWEMWVVDMSTNPNRLQRRTASSPDGPWSAPITCTVDGFPPDDLWHVDVVKNGSGYLATINMCDPGTSGANAYVGFAESEDGLTWKQGGGYIFPTSGVDYVYRGSILDGKLWYSDTTSSRVARILYEEDPPLPIASTPVVTAVHTEHVILDGGNVPPVDIVNEIGDEWIYTG